MRKPLAICLTAALLLGGAGSALAQERGTQLYVGKDGRYGKTSRGHKNVYKNQGRHHGKAKRHVRRGHGKAYGRGYKKPRVNYRNNYRARPYRGQVYRSHYGWQPVPYAYSRRLNHRPGYRYYRSGGDIVLVAIATGIVVQVLRNAIH